MTLALVVDFAILPLQHGERRAILLSHQDVRNNANNFLQPELVPKQPIRRGPVGQTKSSRLVGPVQPARYSARSTRVRSASAYSSVFLDLVAFVELFGHCLELPVQRLFIKAGCLVFGFRCCIGLLQPGVLAAQRRPLCRQQSLPTL
jgi:hypothetical protein